MELKPGYKQTEVGVIPEEWEVPYLRRHLLQDATYGVVKAGAFQRSGIPMLRSGEIKNASIIEDHPLITPEKSQEYSRTILKVNDVVIALVGYPGETAVIPDRLIGANISRAVGLLRPASNLTPEFLTCYLNSPNGRKEFLRPSAGSAQIVVNLGALNKLRLPVPSLPEQRAIATALSDVDGLLRGLDRLIAKKRDLKQAAMQKLLTGQTRLPGFHGEWEVKRLGDVATIKDGTHQTPKYVPAGIPFFSVEHVTSGDFKNTKFISEDEHQFLTRSFKIEKGDILMTRIGSIGDCKLIDWDVDASFYVSLALLRIRPSYSASYIAHYSKSAAFQKEVELHSLQSAIPKKINLGPISNVKIELPPTIPEQTAIASVLTEMDGELLVLEQRWEKTRALKQAMMQELLTGKTRLV